MPKNTTDIRTLASVLRRTNYGEADRILNLLTPTGKISAIARASRKEKSKLAGGIEMFCLSDFSIHRHGDGLGIITSAKMLKFYSNLMTDLARLELASTILKKISLAADSSDSPDFFKIVDQTLPSLNNRANPALVETWFWLNFARACGEEINLYRDTTGAKLSPEQSYVWDNIDSAFRSQVSGNIGADEIKLMRLMVSSDLNVILRVKDIDTILPPLLPIARAINKI